MRYLVALRRWPLPVGNGLHGINLKFLVVKQETKSCLGGWLLRAAPQHDKFCNERFKSALKIQLLADVEAVSITEISDSIADALPSHVP